MTGCNLMHTCRHTNAHESGEREEFRRATVKHECMIGTTLSMNRNISEPARQSCCAKKPEVGVHDWSIPISELC